MNDYVTHTELEQALAQVRVDIDDTERRLRSEFTGAVRYEIGRIDVHLSAQDESLKWIQRFLFGALLSTVCALIFIAAR